MVYATQAQVQDYLPTGYAIGTAPAPSVAQVTQFLTDTAAQIEAAIGSRGLVVPVTTPSWWLAEVTSLNAMGAAALCLAQIFPLMQTQGPQAVGTGGPSLASTLLKQYNDRLADIRKGVGVPVTVPVAEADLAPRSYMSDNNAVGTQDTVTDIWGDLIQSEPAFSRTKVY